MAEGHHSHCDPYVPAQQRAPVRAADEVQPLDLRQNERQAHPGRETLRHRNRNEARHAGQATPSNQALQQKTQRCENAGDRQRLCGSYGRRCAGIDHQGQHAAKEQRHGRRGPIDHPLAARQQREQGPRHSCRPQSEKTKRAQGGQRRKSQQPDAYGMGNRDRQRRRRADNGSAGPLGADFFGWKLERYRFWCVVHAAIIA